MPAYICVHIMHVCVSMCVHVTVCVCVCTCVCMYLYVYVCMCTCMYRNLVFHRKIFSRTYAGFSNGVCMIGRHCFVSRAMFLNHQRPSSFGCYVVTCSVLHIKHSKKTWRQLSHLYISGTGTGLFRGGAIEKKKSCVRERSFLAMSFYFSTVPQKRLLMYSCDLSLAFLCIYYAHIYTCGFVTTQ